MFLTKSHYKPDYEYNQYIILLVWLGIVQLMHPYNLRFMQGPHGLAGSAV